MGEFKEFINELSKNDIVCRCHGVTAGDLLELAKFNQEATTDELLSKLKIGSSCGVCKRKNCKDDKRGKCDIHYSKVLRNR